ARQLGSFELPAAPSPGVAYVEGSSHVPRPMQESARQWRIDRVPAASTAAAAAAAVPGNPLKRQVIPRHSDLELQLLRRISDSVNKNSSLDTHPDPISLLYAALQTHMRPNDKEEQPLRFKDSPCLEGFTSAATLCGMKVEGSPRANKKAAKHAAAMKMIKALSGLARERKKGISLDELD
ncbi:unnamed protein product, partial [Symbiodinium pilosum]